MNGKMKCDFWGMFYLYTDKSKEIKKLKKILKFNYEFTNTNLLKVLQSVTTNELNLM
jgi:hypothetical protein